MSTYRVFWRISLQRQRASTNSSRSAGHLGQTLPALPCPTRALLPLPAWPRNHSLPRVAGLEEAQEEARDGGRRDVAIPCAFPRSLSARRAAALGSVGWTRDAQAPGGGTGMGLGLLLLQRKTPDQYFFNPSEILSRCSAEVGALACWPWRNAVQCPCSLCD